jgi:hypothetical protein
MSKELRGGRDETLLVTAETEVKALLFWGCEMIDAARNLVKLFPIRRPEGTAQKRKV